MILYYTVPLLKNAQYLKVVYMPILVAKQISTLINDLAVKIKNKNFTRQKCSPIVCGAGKTACYTTVLGHSHAWDRSIRKKDKFYSTTTLGHMLLPQLRTLY